MDQTVKDARFDILRLGLEKVSNAYNAAFTEPNGLEIIKKQIPSWLIRIEQIEEQLNQNCYNSQITDQQWKLEVDNWVAAWQKIFDKVKQR